jgi:hypothetical protein
MTKIDFDKFLNYLIWKNFTVKKTNGMRVDVSDSKGRTVGLFRKPDCFDDEYDLDLRTIKICFGVTFNHQEFIEHCKK